MCALTTNSQSEKVHTKKSTFYNMDGIELFQFNEKINLYKKLINTLIDFAYVIIIFHWALEIFKSYKTNKLALKGEVALSSAINLKKSINTSLL